MKFYRFEVRNYASLDYDGDYAVSKWHSLTLVINEFVLIKETAQGYWISSSGFEFGKRWVSKTSRKRYAYPSKQEAMTNFIKRTERRIGILKYNLEGAQLALSLANDYKIEEV